MWSLIKCRGLLMQRDIGGPISRRAGEAGKAKNKATRGFDAGDYFTGPYISSLTKGKSDYRYFEYHAV